MPWPGCSCVFGDFSRSASYLISLLTKDFYLPGEMRRAIFGHAHQIWSVVDVCVQHYFFLSEEEENDADVVSSFVMNRGCILQASLRLIVLIRIRREAEAGLGRGVWFVVWLAPEWRLRRRLE